jgi:CubicO group peptidase (beta-lactamase class C family)/beta-glucosidase-like glycosyl hydrolase
MKNKNNPNLTGILICSLFLFSGYVPIPPPDEPIVDKDIESEWVDTVLCGLSLEHKIGQLFIIESSLKNTPKQTQQLFASYQFGGVLLKDITKESYIKNIEELRGMIKIPLFEVSDALTSFNNQLTDLPNYPSNATFSTLERKYLEQSLNAKLLSDYEEMGINCSLSPNIQSFDNHINNFKKQHAFESKEQLMVKAADKVKKMQSRKILSIANAFDSYQAMTTDTTLEKEDLLEMYRPLIDSGLSAIMIEEQVFDVAIAENDVKDFFKTFLKEQLEFEGLIIGKVTDAISVKELLHAGATSFIIPEEKVATQYQIILELIEQEVISEVEIDAKLRKVLSSKKSLELDKQHYIKRINKTVEQSANLEAQFIRSLYEASIILANNPDSLLPLKDTYTKHYKVINIGAKKLYAFQNSFFRYANFSNYHIQPTEEGAVAPLTFDPIKHGAFVITLAEMNLSNENHGELIQSINQLSKESKVIIVNYGNPNNFAVLDSLITGIQVFECNKITQELVPQLIFGAIQAKGKMPIQVASWMPKGRQIQTPIIRLKYALPEEVGIASEDLSKIADIFQAAIAQKATPGGQVLVAKEGKIIYSKNFGFHTYAKEQMVEKTDLYDVASITKTAATTLAAMRLQQDSIISMQATLGEQMDLPKKATIKKIVLKDLFIHKSGLQRNMPIHTYLNNKGRPKECTPYLCQQSSEEHSLKVAKDFYLNPTYLDSIKWKVSHLPRNYRYRRYLYSDVNFYLIHQLLEEKIKMNLDEYLRIHFYQPLGLRFCTYKPLERFPADVVVPTQDDKFWRKNLVRGYVHDEAAALMGGVGGNAGLFANAQDLAILFQMLLNGGEYGGQAFVKKETIDYFTTSNHGNHRGLGFDKGLYSYTTSKSASKQTYGHTGFSGTCVWVDPEEELIYIFLSNRIHPNPRNRKLKKMRVRQRIHQVIYDAVKAGKTKALTVNMAG